jgi:hypothetical protein
MPIATNPQTGETVFLDGDGAWKKAQTAVNPQTKEMQAFDGQAWVAVPAKSKGVLGYIDDAVRSIANGITFGYADEFAAKMDDLTGRTPQTMTGLVSGKSVYEQNLEKERARNAQIPAAISIPGEVAGAVGSTLLAAPVVAATRIGQAAAALPKALKYGGIGAAEGALAGSGNATEGSRLQGAATGAAIGAPVGAAAPYVVQGVGSAVNAVRNAVSPEANVSADLARAITRDADNPASLMARANDLSIDRPGVATMADAGGENVRGLVERVAQTPGAGRTQVVPALTQRQMGQAARLSGDLKNLTGTGRSAVEAVSETIAARSQAARPLYEQAYAVDVASNQEVVSAFLKEISTGWGKSIINSPALKKTLQTEYGITDTPGPQHLMAVIDAWKKAADDVIREAPGTNKSRVVQQMLERVLPVVDKANPAYAQARTAWSGPSRYLDAIDNGRNILSTKESAEAFSARFRSLSEAEQEAERIGAVSAIIGRMGNDGAKLADMTKYLRSPEVRAKVAALMPTQEAAETWARRLDFEVTSSELTGRALGNSATARRLAERQDAESLAGDLVMDAITGAPQSIIKKVLGAGPKWLRDTMRSRADALLADALTNPDALNKLPGMLQRQAASATPSGQTSALSAAGGAALMAP